MKKLDAYILKKILTTYVFVVVLLVLIICAIDFTEKNDNFIRNNVSKAMVLKYYLTFIPYLASLLTPITAFIATVYVTAKLAAQTEIIAILSSGVSFRRMMFPYFIGATIIAASGYYLNGYVIPDANKFRVGFEIENLKNPFYFTERNIHFKIGPNGYIYLNRYNNHTDVGYHVTLEEFEDNQMISKIHAQRILWDSTQRKWRLDRWQKRTLKEHGELIETGQQLDTVLNLRPADFTNKDKLETTLTMPELKEYIDLQVSRGADDVMVYRIERYIRFMQPFTVLILCFIALIMSARKSRRGTGFQIAAGFFIAFVFIIFFILAKAIAEAGTMNPILAVWMPNIAFVGIGLLLYKTVPR
jgi:lipopolysaccharide export system permease protein